MHAHTVYLQHEIQYTFSLLFVIFLPEKHILNLEMNCAGKIIVIKVYLGSLETMK